MAGCTSDPSLIGQWSVEKVNVGFDENNTTPELVRQLGEMERANRISINADSVLSFSGNGIQKEGRLTTDSQGVMRVDGQVFGLWRDGKVVTSEASPFGEIVVSYRKE